MTVPSLDGFAVQTPSEEGGWQVADTSPVPALPLPSLPVTPLLTWLEASTPLVPQSISQLRRALWVPALSLHSEQPSRWLPASGAEVGSVPVPCCQPQPQGAACVGAGGLEAGPGLDVSYRQLMLCQAELPIS